MTHQLIYARIVMKQVIWIFNFMIEQPFNIIIKNIAGQSFERGMVVKDNTGEFVFHTTFFDKHIKDFGDKFTWIAIEVDLVRKLMGLGIKKFNFYNKNHFVLYASSGDEIVAKAKPRFMNKRYQYLLPINCEYSFFTKKNLDYDTRTRVINYRNLDDIPFPSSEERLPPSQPEPQGKLF